VEQMANFKVEAGTLQVVAPERHPVARGELRPRRQLHVPSLPGPPPGFAPETFAFAACGHEPLPFEELIRRMGSAAGGALKTALISLRCSHPPPAGFRGLLPLLSPNRRRPLGRRGFGCWCLCLLAPAWPGWPSLESRRSCGDFPTVPGRVILQALAVFSPCRNWPSFGQDTLLASPAWLVSQGPRSQVCSPACRSWNSARREALGRDLPIRPHETPTGSVKVI